MKQIAEARTGSAAIRACSSTRRSTTGTRARTRPASTPRIPAASTCSSTTRRAIWRRLNLMKFYTPEGRLRCRRLPARGPTTITRAGDPGRQRLLPDQVRSSRDRSRCLPPARPGLRQPGRAADGSAVIAYDSEAGRATTRLRSPSLMCGEAYLHVGRDRRATWARSPGTRLNRSRCCAVIDMHRSAAR